MEHMEESTEIRISYGNEDEAASAYPYVEGMIKCFYLYHEGYSFDLDGDEDARSDLFRLFVLDYGECIRDCDQDQLLEKYPDCALRFLHQDGADIILDQCAGIQGAVPDLQTQSREGFFNCLCFILALLIPLKPFQAICRHTGTGADPVQVTRAEYDAIVIHFEQSLGEQGSPVTADWVIAPECITKRK